MDDIEDAVDRLLEPSKPSFRRPLAHAFLKAEPTEEDVPPPRPAPVEDRIETAAAFSRIVLIVPRYRGPDADDLREWLLTDGTARASQPEDAPRLADPVEGSPGWSAAVGPKGGEQEVFVEVMRWDDLPRAAMPLAIRWGFKALARTAWTYLSSGAARSLARLNRNATARGFAGGGILAAESVLSLAVGAVAGGAIASALGDGARWLGWPTAPFLFLAGIVGACAALLILRMLRGRDAMLGAYDRLRPVAYLSSARGAYPHELDRRVSAFAGRIGWALRQPVDEVLVVGHGDGAALAVSAVAEAVRWGELPPGAPALSLLTLGQTIPLVGFLPDAARLRADLRDVSLREDICWVDVSDPSDARAFALSDPVAVCGVALDDRHGPLVLAAGGRQDVGGPLGWLRGNPIRRHDRYLRAPEGSVREYDWQRVLLGPLTLRKLLSGRPPAPGRIDLRATDYASTARPRPEPDDDEDDDF